MRIAHAITFAFVVVPAVAGAQRSGPPTTRADSLKQASQFDLDGSYSKARNLFQKLIDTAPNDASRAEAQRAKAISFAFTSDCTNASKLEEQVIAYWQTQEQAAPQNAFYQEGEVSNEEARICFDAGDIESAEVYYRRGSQLGLKEPEPKTHPASLWDFRLTNALARVATKKGRYAEALQLVTRARAILDSDPKMAAQQVRFFPSLQGFVQFYSITGSDPGQWQTAERSLREAVAFPGNDSEPYMFWMLADLYSRNQRTAEIMMDYCHRAIARATAHNPPSAFVHAHAKECLAPLR
jgi:tetratricopeptide (TPR) repeat protein